MNPAAASPGPSIPSRSPITTHVLDTSLGRPAAGVPVELLRGDTVIASGITDASGRLSNLLPAGRIEPGMYRLRFDTAAYARLAKHETFYPEVIITFAIAAAEEHFHVPLILSPFGYSTYRGSH